MTQAATAYYNMRDFDEAQTIFQQVRHAPELQDSVGCRTRIYTLQYNRLCTGERTRADLGGLLFPLTGSAVWRVSCESIGTSVEEYACPVHG